MATPLMGLDLPVVGPSGTIGPDWANKINAALDKIDSHDHSAGKGISIPFSSINVTQDFDFLNYGLKNVDFLAFETNLYNVTNYPALFVKLDNGYSELYYKYSSSGYVKITEAGDVKSGGGIGGMTGTAASVTYSDISKLFAFKQYAAKNADIAGGSLLIYDNSVNSGNYTKIKSSTTAGQDLEFTFPDYIPGANDPHFLICKDNGVLDYDYPFKSIDASNNYRLTSNVSSNALTIVFQDQSGSTPSTNSPVEICYDTSNETFTSVSKIKLTNNTGNITISYGSTLGHSNNVGAWIFVYAAKMPGDVLKLAVSSTLYKDGSYTITNEGGAGAANSATAIYSNFGSTQTGLIKLIGRFYSDQSTAGTWAATLQDAELITSSNKIIAGSTISTLSIDSPLSAAFANNLALSTSYQNIPSGMGGSSTILLNNRPVVISINISLNNGDAAARSVLLQLLKGTTVLRTYIMSLASAGTTGDARNITDFILDSGGTGQVTYKLQAKFSSGTTLNAYLVGTSAAASIPNISKQVGDQTGTGSTTGGIRALEIVQL